MISPSWTHRRALFIIFFFLKYYACVKHYVSSVTTFKALFPCCMPRPLTLLPIQKCQDTVEALRDQLTSYYIQVCSTCILQDVESHQWADPKPFYEVTWFSEIYLLKLSSSPKGSFKDTSSHGVLNTYVPKYV